MSLFPIDKEFKVSSKLKGVHFGIVVDNIDEDQLGGIRVKIAGILECEEVNIKKLPLIYPAQDIGGTQDNNSIKIPSIGTQVLIEFIEEDPYSGIYRASIMSKKAFPEVFKESYPNSMGETWAGETSQPSWFRINKQENYVEVFLMPSKTLIKIDLEGSVFINSVKDISIISESSINLTAKNNINLFSDKVNVKTNTYTIDSVTKNENSTTWNSKSTNSNLDLGTLIKKSISEVYSTSSYGVTVPKFVIDGILNSANSTLGLINGTAIAALFTGGAVYSGGPYTPSPISPGVITPIDLTPIQTSSEIISYIKNLTQSFILDYTTTSELMKLKSTELRTQFKAMAFKMTGSRDYKIPKAETNYLDPFPLAEELVIAKTSVNELEKIKADMAINQIDANSNLGNLQSTYSSKVLEAHPDLASGYGPNNDYKKIVSELDLEVQKEVLDKYNSTAPDSLKLPLPPGQTSFENTPPDVFSQWFGAIPKESFLPVVNGTIFNLANFLGLSTWAKTNSLTTVTNDKQENVIPTAPSNIQTNFNAFVEKVRLIEIVSCKIYELIKLIQDLINAIQNLQIDLNKVLAAILSIEVLLPSWILDLVNQLINGIKTGDLPKTCQVGTVSSEELQTLPDDLAKLLGKQNKIVIASYQNSKLYSTMVSNLQPTTEFLESATNWSKTSAPSSGVNIIGLP